MNSLKVRPIHFYALGQQGTTVTNLNIFKEYYLVRKFPKGYPLYRKIFDNVAFFIAALIIRPRDNLLNKRDRILTRLKIRRGDIVLVGNLRAVFSLFVDGPVTHSTLYAGYGRFIHAHAAGVEYISMREILALYDTLMILRVKNVPGRKKIRRNVIRTARRQIDKPFNFTFNTTHEAWFCTQLVNETFLSSGYDTGVSTFRVPEKPIEKIKQKITNAAAALRPIDFCKGNFDVIFHSHTIEKKGDKYIFVKP